MVRGVEPEEVDFEEMHYFRNKLNKVPTSLNHLLEINQSLPKDKKWILLPPTESGFHMYGENGVYNLKFLSADGTFEAVYDRQGRLVTDPRNMGTYNYVSHIVDKDLHSKYDIAPYFDFGNTKEDGEKDGATEYGKAALNVAKWETNLEAKRRWIDIKTETNPSKSPDIPDNIPDLNNFPQKSPEHFCFIQQKCSGKTNFGGGVC